MAARDDHKHGLAKFLMIFNLIGLFVVFLLTIHLVKNVRLLAQNQANNSQNQIQSVSYDCDAGKKIQAVYFQDKVELMLPGGQSMLLMQAMSASGVRYTNSDESVTFWNKGTTAFMEQGPNDTVTYNNCNQTASN